MQKHKETGNSRYIYQNELDKASFQHDMISGDFKDLTRRKASKKTLRDKTFNMAKYPKYDGYQRGLALMVYKFFDKKTFGGTVKNENISNKEQQKDYKNQSLENLTKKVQSPFIDNIWGADFANMQLISKFNKGICFSLCVIDIYSKYAWFIHLKVITIANAFQKI